MIVEFSERLGADTFLHAPDHPAGSLIVKHGGGPVGSGPMRVGADWDKALLFDEAGLAIERGGGAAAAPKFKVARGSIP
jgi:hypothetical protein